MAQHRPMEVIGGEQCRIEVWEDPEQPGWRWHVTAAPLDENLNVSGAPRVVAQGAGATRKKAEQAARQWLDDRLNPKA